MGVGIATFSYFIETLPNRIACEFSGGAGAWVPAGGVAGSRKPGVRLSGTGVAFAGEKWVFLACFSVAEVSPVSTVAVHGRAVVMAVSRWPASAAAEASLVSTSPRRCVPCAKKFALRRCRHREGTKKFAAPWCGPEAPHSHTQSHTAYTEAPGAVAPGAPGNK